MATFIYSESFCQKSAERKSPKKYFSYIVLMSARELDPWQRPIIQVLNTLPYNLQSFVINKWQVYLLSEFLPGICWEKITESIFRFDICPGIRTQTLLLIITTSTKPTHYLLVVELFVHLSVMVELPRCWHSISPKTGKWVPYGNTL